MITKGIDRTGLSLFHDGIRRRKMQMQLLGQPVRHISFGKGVIADISDRFVTIRFEQGDKKFLYPDAFYNFLTLKDTEKQETAG